MERELCKAHVPPVECVPVRAAHAARRRPGQLYDFQEKETARAEPPFFVVPNNPGRTDVNSGRGRDFALSGGRSPRR